MSYFATGAALTAALNALPASLTGSYKAFDAFYYAGQYMTNYTGTLTPIEHFVQIGAARGYKPNANFDPAFYQSQYSDLAGLDAADLLFHYVKFGLNEGRAGNASLAAVNWADYLAAYPAVATYVNANLSSFNGSATNGAIAHYVKFGAAQGFALPNPAGQSFVTTIMADNLVGTAGNDTFTARDGIVFNSTGGAVVTPTLQSADAIDGGAGNDTLNVISATAIDLVTPVAQGLSVKNVETVNLTSNATVSAITSNFAGLNTLNVTESGGTTTAGVQAAATTDINLTDLAVGTAGAVTIKGGKAVTATVSGITTTSGTVTIGDATYAPTGAVKVTLNEGGGTAGSTSGVLSVVGGLTVDLTSNITAPTVATTAGTATSAYASPVGVTGGATTSSVTVKQSAPVTAVTYAPGTGAASATAEVTTLTLATTGFASGKSITIGGLTITAGTGFTSTGTAAQAALVTALGGTAGLTAGATAGATVTGLTYSGTLTGFNVSAATTGVVTAVGATTGDIADLTYSDTNIIASVATTQGVAAVAASAATNAVAGIINGGVTITDKNSSSATLANTITSVTLDAYGTAAINSNALKTLSLANSLSGVTVTDNGTVKNASLDVTVNNVGKAGTAASITDNTITALNVTATGKASVLSLTGAALTTVTVAGDQKVDLGTSPATVTSVTSTNSAGVTVTLNAASTGTFGSGADVVTVGAGATKAVNLGGGNDTAIVSTLATSGSVAGGDGIDTLQISGSNAATASATTAFAAAVTGFEKLVIDGSGTGVDPSKLGGYHDITIMGTSPSVTLVNMTSGDKLTLTTASSAVTTGQADGAVGTADVLNLAVTSTAGVAFGSVTATGVETVNLTTANTAATAATAVPIADSLTIFGNDAKTITVAGNAKLALTAASTALTSLDASAMSVSGLGAGTATTGLTWSSGALTTAAVIKGSATGGDVIDASLSTKAVTITEYAGANNIKGSSTIASTLTGGTGADTITGGAGADTIVGGGGADVITGGAGADSITLSGTGTIVQAAAGNSGANTSTSVQPTELTATFDIVRGAAAGAKIDLTAFAAGNGVGGKYTTTDLTLAATTLAATDNKVVFVSGTYDAAAGIFSYAANGLDTAVTYDTNAATGTVAAETIILVGYHAGATTTATAGVITLG